MKKLLLTLFLLSSSAAFAANIALLWTPYIPPPAGGAPVELTGTGALDQDSTGGSFAVTVPADADMIVVAATGYPGDGVSVLLDEINFDNGADTDFTQIAWQYWDATYDGATVDTWMMTDTSPDWPGSGAKTVYWSAAGSVDEGTQIYVFFLKNTDTASPIVDTEGKETGSAGWTSSLTGVGSDDLGIVACYAWNGAPNINPTGSGQTTVVSQGPFNTSGLGVGVESGEGALQITGSDTVCVAFGVRAG